MNKNGGVFPHFYFIDIYKIKMKNMKIKFSYIVLGLSLAVAGCAAYFSVWGLSQLFAGASLSVIIMASILELGKIVSTTALHRYWNKLAIGLKTYLTVSVVVLMIITSVGIYGFLSNAYQKTANKLEIHEGKVGVLDGKKQLFIDALTANNKIIETKNKRIEQLSGLRLKQENRIDISRSNTNALRNDINSSNSEIQKLSTEIDVLNNKNAVLNDSINKYQTKTLEAKSGSDVAGEVGPLKFVSELTGISMDRVVNYMILLLIFVFDPLAIALVLITNRIFQIENEVETEVKNIDDNMSNTVNDTVNDGVNDGVNDDETHIEQDLTKTEPIVENKRFEPVTKTGKIELEDIKEIKERRGYSVPIPEPKTNNTVQRIGNNKLYQQNGNNNSIIYKKNGDR